MRTSSKSKIISNYRLVEVDNLLICIKMRSHSCETQKLLLFALPISVLSTSDVLDSIYIYIYIALAFATTYVTYFYIRVMTLKELTNGLPQVFLSLIFRI